METVPYTHGLLPMIRTTPTQKEQAGRARNSSEEDTENWYLAHFKSQPIKSHILNVYPTE